MFEQAVLSRAPASKRVWSALAGVTGQALMVGIAVMVPMIWTESLPGQQTLLRVFTPGVPAGRPPRERAAPVRFTRAVPRQWTENGLVQPVRAPAHPQMLVDPPELAPPAGAAAGVAGGTGMGPSDGVLAGMLDAGSRIAPPPRPAEAAHAPAGAAAAPAPIQRVKVGGNVHLGPPIRRVEPVYPRIASTARVSGVVELEAVVGIDGHIRELRVKSGNPLLAPAAVEAVRQWIYEPTTLNGDPVEIIAPITVTFHLN